MCITQTNEQVTKLYKSFEKMRRKAERRRKNKRKRYDGRYMQAT
jgi:hypothetical protein